MAGEDIDDDEYVANLLKQDAKEAAKKYEMVGLEAFKPTRSRLGAPKPNTKFLRHIIRQTDNHNAALLAKEAEESRARLKAMDRERERDERHKSERRGRSGRLTPPDLSDEEPRYKKRRRLDHSDDEMHHGDVRRRKQHDKLREVRPRTEKDSERARGKRRTKSEDGEHDDRSRPKSRHSKHYQERERRRRYVSDSEEDLSRHKEGSSRKRRRKRSYSRSTSRSPRHTSSRYRQRSRSPKRSARDSNNIGEISHRSYRKRSTRPSPTPASDSDPLEAIVGPLPPPAQPAVRSRGRGARKANSMGMDARFSSTYDPSVDVQLKSDVEDDWGDALETVKDRQRWKQQGAERLKAAGFTDEQVRSWEKGDAKNEEDVVWSSRGQAREWDRGKVVDEDGDVELKAEWGRLK